ncbi:MAG TPA: anaerobic ribonucleoside-triphosphate reductase activating protein [Terrisporobacter glycolicus]|uniref:anaerobic ribonucleoside-triphosphate reductase activating protein n=1 Tax=Terrisporobacter TaxID=1505652 RepID=UPI000E94F1C8|nr:MULTISPECIES: anaerobic ribonucleoside-triphosphate reductase activating protein [Terrisporobacter]HBI92721.1 anaerobic ribonucleoside-triphosphate reductase activating protein [Terrisporobacter hibernicus]
MRINRIKDNDIANGFGITMSLWTQGCPHKCKGCFNSETWSFTDGEEFTEEKLSYIMDNIDKHNIRRDLSILGGEPLCPENIEGVIYVCKKFKNKYPEKKIYLWTGYTVENFNEFQKEILKYADVLVDGKFEEERKNISLTLRGSSNQRVINVKETLKENKLILFDLENK